MFVCVCVSVCACVCLCVCVCHSLSLSLSLSLCEPLGGKGHESSCEGSAAHVNHEHAAGVQRHGVDEAVGRKHPATVL